jgi:hypothetical protein
MNAAIYTRILLAALCGLHALAASASVAAGAWVLWERTWEETWWSWGRGRVEWTPLAEAATPEECEKELARLTKTNETSSARKTPFVAWRCLPDNVDPRAHRAPLGH